MSLGETLMRPTAMLFRNLASMDVEESIRANPIDGVVLLVRLRQDHAGAADGRGELRPAGDRRLRRPDAERQVPRPGHRLGHRRLADVSEDVRAGKMTLRRLHGGRGLHVALGRPLHDHGHGLDDGVHGRGAGHGPAEQRGDSRGRFAPLRAGAHGGPAHRRDGARGPADVEDPDPQGVRERDPRQRARSAARPTR